ncbi:hypothetical protein ACOMHN_005963 [Nucella lapillus]
MVTGKDRISLIMDGEKMRGIGSQTRTITTPVTGTQEVVTKGKMNLGDGAVLQTGELQILCREEYHMVIKMKKKTADTDCLNRTAVTLGVAQAADVTLHQAIAHTGRWSRADHRLPRRWSSRTPGHPATEPENWVSVPANRMLAGQMTGTLCVNKNR